MMAENVSSPIFKSILILNSGSLITRVASASAASPQPMPFSTILISRLNASRFSVAVPLIPSSMNHSVTSKSFCSAYCWRTVEGLDDSYVLADLNDLTQQFIALGKYSWPTFRHGKDDMDKLYKDSEWTGKPITIFLKEAVWRIYRVEGEAEP